jgi:uncharacterized membrane protein YedE/YeeE
MMAMKGLATALGSGALFGVGLAISGMTKPSKVVGFLDLFGAWDASLAFVMVGAIAVHAVAYRLVIGRAATLFDRRFHVPTRRDVDARLVLGAALFGAGWALAGYCPGPGLVTAASGSLAGIVFVVAMAIGMKLEHVHARVRTLGRSTPPELPE